MFGAKAVRTIHAIPIARCRKYQLQEHVVNANSSRLPQHSELLDEAVKDDIALIA